MKATPPPDPADWLNDHGDYLYRYAFLQLRDASTAEDMVQETLLAALTAWARFSGGSSVRTWLTGILKHKILDHFRRVSREPQFQSLAEDETDVEALDRAIFDQANHWIDMPQAWGDPEACLSQQRFMEILAFCLEQLPEHLAMAFNLRELSGLTTEEICKEMNVSPTNCWVMLYRARIGLQQCLQARWDR